MCVVVVYVLLFFFFKQKTAYEMRISDWSSDVCSSDLLEPLGAQWTLDWGGGLIWLALDGEVDTIRAAAETAGGQAMLVRAPEAIRGSVPAQHLRHPQVAALEARVRRAFDPAGIFATGRFLGAAHADRKSTRLNSSH